MNIDLETTFASLSGNEKSIITRGVARIFQRGGHTVSDISVMAFSPRNIIGCFLKNKGLQRGGGVTGTPEPPSLRP